MREKEAEGSPGGRYMSPLVKQDLARLDKDGESRRSAMNSLKQFVENLDPGSMPRFLAQVSESRDQGVSRSYAISLYEEVARVHGKLIIPHIPRVMATVTRSLSSSGSSPQLHQACAKVVSALARYSVDGGLPVQAEEILRELCNPLLGLLAGKLEPLAAGAAVCLQALVECEKWKHASDEVVNEACLRTTVALGEKPNRTVAHMQLAKSLATTNPSFFNGYGVALLRTGSEILRQTPASGTWQQRVCAARLLQAVLPTVDRAVLASELEHTIQVLEDCKHDRMPHVRTAVSGALKTAKEVSSHDSRVAFDGEDPPPDIPYLRSLDLGENLPNKSSSEMRSLFGGSDDLLTSGSKQGSSPADFSEDSILSFLPYASPESSISTQGSPSRGKHRRSLLPQLVSFPDYTPQPSSIICVYDLEAYLNLGRSCEVQAKENVPSRNLDVNAGVSCDSGPSSGGSICSGQFGKHGRSRPPTAPGFNISDPPFLGDKMMGTDQQSRDIEASSVVMSKGRGGKTYSSLEDSVITVHRKQEGVDILNEDEEVSSNGTTVDIEVETGMNSSHENLQCRQNRYDNQVDMRTSSFDLVCNSSSRLSQNQTALNGPTRKNLFDVGGSPGHGKDESVGGAHSAEEGLCDSSESHDFQKSYHRSCDHRQSRHSPPLPHLRSPEDVSSPQKPRALITADDFLPFSTPRRLVRSLQSNLSSSAGSSTVKDQDTELPEEEGAEMDLETCSEAGWSVRDNPMASDDSFNADSEEEDNKQRGKVCQKMGIDSSTRNCSAELDTDNLLTNDSQRLSLSRMHAAESLFCTSTGRTLEPESLTGVEDIRNDKLDHKVNEFCSEPAHPRGGLQSLVGENGECFCSVSASDKCGVCLIKEGAGDADTCLTHDLYRDKTVGVLRIRFHHSVRDIFGKRLRRVETYAEVFLRGFLLVVLALPFAMVMSKILWSYPDHPELIPT